MPAILTRLILALAAVLLAPAVFVALFIVLDAMGWSDDAAFLFAAMLSVVLFTVAWIAVWRGEVQWTKRRCYTTAVAVLVSAGIATVCGAIVGGAMRYSNVEFGIIMASLFWLPAWIASTAVVWRETPHERALRMGTLLEGRVRCPDCGYDMTGLTEARCPECGTQYTLNELFSALQEATHRLPNSEWKDHPAEPPS